MSRTAPSPLPPELPSPAAAGGSLGASAACSSLGAPTLTTPTLTPTTLRNIEQMFAESDPHEPPHHHLNAAGFVPPIVSPTSGNSYAPLGFPAPLILPRQVQIKSEANSRTAQSDLKPPARPQTLSLARTESLTLPRPDTLALSRPDTLSLSRPDTLPLSRPDSLTLTRPNSLSIARPDSLPLVLPEPLPFSRTSPLALSRPDSLVLARPDSLPLSLARPQTLAVPLLNGGGGGGGLPARNIEFLDKFLKAAASSPLLNTPVVSAINNFNLSPVKREPVNVKHEGGGLSDYILSTNSPPPYPDSPSPRPSSSSPSSFSPPAAAAFTLAAMSGGGGNGPAAQHSRKSVGGRDSLEGCYTERFQEDVKRAVRRERNKQAAARCRKRRLDLISSLQEEVADWELKVKSLKDELIQLEGQKKGLELVLSRHAGPCRVSRPS